MLKRGPRNKPTRIEDKTRTNERITAEEVRVVTDEGEQLGVLPIKKAIQAAKDRNLDLVEVAESAKPPVCKIMDYGKFKFEQAKKAKQAKTKQHIVKVKEIKLHPKTDVNDYNYRMKHAKEFLAKGYKVKVSMVFRGREMAHIDYGRKLLVQMEQDLEEHSELELKTKMEGNTMVTIFAPLKSNRGGKSSSGKADKSEGTNKEDNNA